ncbi:MAG: PLP-dependent cysteine synthase family protein [Elusimicrobia bacterium]|nr:PLP-dependent cysteine synthase family protein [Elusimicrobiota bacterium]
MPVSLAAFAPLSVLIGNTPLLTIRLRWRGEARRVFAKAEHFNLTGSIKDRMALHLLREAYRRGELAPGAPIAEATSGNTGISLAAVGRALGHPVHVFMPDWMSRERIDLMRSLGARVRLVSREEGGFLGSIRLCEEFAASAPGAFLPRQFSNADNVAAHEQTTGPELWHQLGAMGLEPDAFVAGVGTGGTIMGAGRYLRGRRPSVKLHPLEPANSPTLSTGRKTGRHRIQGISDEFIPPIVELDTLDAVLAVDDGDAIQAARKLSSELGLAVGISSGANLLGALLAQDRLGKDAVVATVFPDDNKKYLSTDLMQEQPVHERSLSAALELTGFEAARRSCRTCRVRGEKRRGAALPR